MLLLTVLSWRVSQAWNPHQSISQLLCPQVTKPQICFLYKQVFVRIFDTTSTTTHVLKDTQASLKKSKTLSGMTFQNSEYKDLSLTCFFIILLESLRSINIRFHCNSSSRLTQTWASSSSSSCLLQNKRMRQILMISVINLKQCLLTVYYKRIIVGLKTLVMSHETYWILKQFQPILSASLNIFGSDRF